MKDYAAVYQAVNSNRFETVTRRVSMPAAEEALLKRVLPHSIGSRAVRNRRNDHGSGKRLPSHRKCISGDDFYSKTIRRRYLMPWWN